MLLKTYGGYLVPFVPACHYVKYQDVYAAVFLYTALMAMLMVVGICAYAAEAVLNKGTLADMEKGKSRVTVRSDAIWHIVALVAVLLMGLFVIW